MCLYYSVYRKPEKKGITNIHRLLFKQTEFSKTAVLLTQAPLIGTLNQDSFADEYSFSWKSSELFVLALSCDRKTYQVLISTSPPLPSPFLPLTSFCHLRFPSSPLRVLL